MPWTHTTKQRSGTCEDITVASKQLHQHLTVYYLPSFYTIVMNPRPARHLWLLLGILWLQCLASQSLAAMIHSYADDGMTSPSYPDHHIHHSLAELGKTPLLQKATMLDIEAARKIVQEAIAKASKLNEARLEHPARNRYWLKPGTLVMGPSRSAKRLRQDAEDEPPPPLLEITPEIAAAAALVAEADAVANSTGVSHIQKRGTFWMEHIARRGSHPTSWGGSAGYKVSKPQITNLSPASDERALGHAFHVPTMSRLSFPLQARAALCGTRPMHLLYFPNLSHVL